MTAVVGKQEAFCGGRNFAESDCISACHVSYRSANTYYTSYTTGRQVGHPGPFPHLHFHHWDLRHSALSPSTRNAQCPAIFPHNISQNNPRYPNKHCKHSPICTPNCSTAVRIPSSTEILFPTSYRRSPSCSYSHGACNT